MEMDELTGKYYETYAPDIYPQNREDLQRIIMEQVNIRIKQTAGRERSLPA